MSAIIARTHITVYTWKCSSIRTLCRAATVPRVPAVRQARVVGNRLITRWC